MTTMAVAIPTQYTKTLPQGPYHAKEVAKTMSLSSAVAAGLDPSDPDSLFDFFQTQMRSVQGKLSDAMQSQDLRRQQCEELQAIQGRMSEYSSEGGAGIKPGSPKWDAFVADAQRAIELVGPSSREGQSIKAMLDQGTQGAWGTKTTLSFAEAHDLAASSKGTVNVVNTAPGLVQYDVTGYVGSPAGLTKDQVASVGQQLKARTDSLQQETALAMIRVQQYVEQCSQIVSHCSNVLRKFHEMQMAAIDNLRG